MKRKKEPVEINNFVMIIIKRILLIFWFILIPLGIINAQTIDSIQIGCLTFSYYPFTGEVSLDELKEKVHRNHRRISKYTLTNQDTLHKILYCLNRMDTISSDFHSDFHVIGKVFLDNGNKKYLYAGKQTDFLYFGNKSLDGKFFKLRPYMAELLKLGKHCRYVQLESQQDLPCNGEIGSWD